MQKNIILGKDLKKENNPSKTNPLGNNSTVPRKNTKYSEIEEAKKKSLRVEGGTYLQTSAVKEKEKDKDKEEKINPAVTLSINKITPQVQSSAGSLQSFDLGLNTISMKNLSHSAVMNTHSNITSSSSSSAANVNVICRFRPLNEKEKNSTKDISVEFLDSQQISIRSIAENNIYKFSFDKIFDMSCTQQEVYDTAAKPIIDSVLEGFNGTIFAYGQTSSGKTHTMQGVLDNPEKEGIIPRMIRNVFNHILHAGEEMEFTVKVSMVEIYMEKIRDLIDPSRNNLNVREEKSKGVFIEDLSERYCSNEEEVLDIMKLGSNNRATNATNMNEHSSRSHSIFIMTIHQNNIKDLVAKTGKLYLVDLAGSEKISKTGATGELLEEAKTINKSLTTLGMVINSLTDGKSLHVPYRDSKLTRVLQESLGGNARTCLIITCSPSSFNEAETLSTLRFGLRAKKIKNKPKINKEVTVAELKLEIDKLEKLIIVQSRRIEQLQKFIIKSNLNVPEEGDFSFMNRNDEETEQNVKKKDKVMNMLEEEIKNLNEDLIANENENLETVYVGTETNAPIETVGDMIAGENIETEKREQNEKEKSDSAENGISAEQREAIKELTEKYTNVINKISILEENKKDLSDELENAISRLKENSDTIEQKNRIIEELQLFKINFEAKEQELYEKINELQEKLDLEKNAIKITETIKSKARSDSDVINIEEPNNISPHKSNLKEEIFEKIEDIIISTATSENSENNSENVTVHEKLNSLINFIKNKLNLTTEVSSNSTTPTNYEKSIHKNFELEIPNTVNIPSSNQNQTQNSNTNIYINTINEDAIKKEKKRFENEKKLILKALEEKAEKITQLEGDNKDLRERIKLYESKMSPDDKNYVKKIVTLEKSLEQVNLMYHQVVTQKSVLKIENQVLEKKIKKRNEKISMIDKENNDLREQLRMRDDKLTYYQKSYIKSANAPSNVVKVIKGGHVKQNAVLNGENILNQNESSKQGSN